MSKPIEDCQGPCAGVTQFVNDRLDKWRESARNIVIAAIVAFGGTCGVVIAHMGDRDVHTDAEFRQEVRAFMKEMRETTEARQKMPPRSGVRYPPFVSREQK